MNTNDTTQPTTETTSEPTRRSTYCPDDNRIRLYVGRVPRDEYEALMAEGWTSTPKQSCDFVATWTPQRRDTALDYAGIIEDEDQSPAERAADRAERFAGYQAKRLGEALGGAEKYEAGPSVYGFQDPRRGERMLRKFDRVAARAVDAWDKAEYWTARTAGVISNALYKSEPSVRLGRIKELELAIARHEKYGRDDSWTNHFRLRLAYENAMLEAAGGRASCVEMVVGGWWGGLRIHGINRSTVTGLVTSLDVFGTFHTYKKGERVAVEGVHSINIERDTAGKYQAPTPEELAEFEAAKKAEKKAKREAKKDLPPAPKLTNPTDEDAERLQALFNAEMLASLGDLKDYFIPSAVLRITQDAYSENSKGSYAMWETVDICANGVAYRSYSQYRSAEREAALAKQGPILCSVRIAHRSDFYSPSRVIVLTDKPQKPLPAGVWSPHIVPAVPVESGEVVNA
jgi:Domain of unknown function (DUF3560)